jgi:hypothetical protein
MFESSELTVRPRATVDGNSPTVVSRKAERIKIGGHIKYDYPDDAVTLGMRGTEKAGQARYLRGHSYLSPQETPKKGKLGNTPLGASVGQ